MSSEINIYFYMVGGETPLCERKWGQVPRIGDEFSYYDGKKNWILKVHKVIWGSLEESFLGYQDCEARVYCKTT